MSNFDMNFQMPAVYILKRVSEEYQKASAFVAEYLQQILDEYQELNKATPKEVTKN